MNNKREIVNNLSLTIDDLKYDELRLILNQLSVRQLFNCLTVCHKWYSIITELLASKPVLSLYYNDIHYYTKEELSQRCDHMNHLAINASVGRVMGGMSYLSVYTTPSFTRIAQKLFNLFDFCPNIQSLDLRQYSLNISDIDILVTRCPRLQCLYITSDEINWTKFLCPHISALKHFSVSLTKGKPIYGVYEKPIEMDSTGVVPQIEDLIISRPMINEINLKIFCHYLQTFGTELKKLYFIPENKITESEAMDVINALVANQSNKSMVKNLNLNVFVFEGYLDAINANFPDIETLYLHFNNESQHKDSLKKLKKLKQIHLDFDSNVNVFAFDGIHSESDFQYNSFLSRIPSTLTELTLFDAVISLSVFMETINYLPLLTQLELNYVFIENDCQQSVWQVISNFKSLQYLILNSTNISDDGFEYLASSESLHTLELVRYKGPNSAQTLMDSYKVIEVFAQLASLKPKQWFCLRLDRTVFEVNDQIKRQIPRNVKLVNIGHKR